MKVADGRHYERQKFANLVEHGRTLSRASFSDCSFTKCAFAGAVFRDGAFIDCLFRECDLSSIKVPDTNWVNCRFVGSKVIGVDWAEAGGAHSKLPLSLAFEGCNVSYSSFFGLSVTGLVVERCIAYEVEFGEANLSDGVFTGTDFHGSTFHHTNLSRADFSGAKNYTIDPTANTVKRAIFSLPEAVSLLRGFEVILR